MSRSKRFSGNLIVQPEAIENASEQGGFGVLSCVRGYIALVGETKWLHSEPRSGGDERHIRIRQITLPSTENAPLGLLRVMRLSPEGFHDQTDQDVGNGVRR
jgi:hypothetical protein